MAKCGICLEETGHKKADLWNGMCDECFGTFAYAIHHEHAIIDVVVNANENKHKKPNIHTLTEEFAKAYLAYRGKHDDPLRLELVQIAGICINMIRQIDAGKDLSRKAKGKEGK